MRTAQILFLVGMVILMSLGGPSVLEVSATPDPFPTYDCLKPNVAFWKKVYSRYSTTQGIIHDSEDLSIIYDVIALRDSEQPGAEKINSRLIKNAKKQFENILKKLARGAPPSSFEERRVASLFGPKATPGDFRKAAKNIRCQLGQKDRFREGVIRSGAFLDQIKEIFESYGLPADLAYLPHVESSFNLHAYSKFGAAGMWQFTHSTGKKFLEVGYTLDERREPIVSSHAAAKLLKGNYEILGDWPSAITAYNHGLAGMRRAKRSKGSYEAIFKGYRSRIFKFASRNFYSEFLAAREVAKNYQQYFGELELDKPWAGQEILLEGYLPVMDLARHFDLEIDVIRAFNPSLRAPVYTGQKYIPKGYKLRLPLTAGVRGDSVVAGWPRHLYRPEQKRSLFYRVQRGDTASEIAEAHGLRLSELLVANGLDSRARIYVGQNLRLPAPDKKPDRLVMAATTTAGDHGQVPRKPASVDKKPKSMPREQTSEKAYIAVPPEKLSIDKATANAAVVSGNLFVQKVTTLNGKPVGTIRVIAEETLGHYADWLGVATQEIRKLNGRRYGSPLRLSEWVRIPLDRTSKVAFEEKRFEYHKEIEEDFFEAYEIENFEKYTVKKGDSIWSLSYDVFEVPLWLIVKYNPDVDFNTLKPLQQLVVPVIAEKST